MQNLRMLGFGLFKLYSYLSSRFLLEAEKDFAESATTKFSANFIFSCDNFDLVWLLVHFLNKII